MGLQIQHSGMGMNKIPFITHWIIVILVLGIHFGLLFNTIPSDPIVIETVTQTIPFDLYESSIDDSNVTNETIQLSPLTQLENLTITLDRDPGSEKEYNKTYNCMHFSIDLVTNLTDYDCGCVSKTSKVQGLGGHYLVWINISNQIYYIEPQSDKIMTKEKFISNINSSKYIIREITLEQAKRNEADQRRWKI